MNKPTTPSATDEDFLALVIQTLQAIGELTFEEMFGGHALYHHGYLFGIVFRGRLFFRTNSGSREPYLNAGMQPFAPSGRVTLRDYFEVPGDVQKKPGELCAWARRAASAQN